jgi:putative ABC transport system substrate-binding protein
MVFHRLTRRQLMFIGGAAAWPLGARSQPSDRMRRIGVLIIFSQSDAEPTAWLKAFQDELHKFGWEQGRDLQFENHFAGIDSQRLRNSAAELVAKNPDAIFAVTTLALAALNQEAGAIPIVFVQVSDPVRLGFVTSLARPGGNITGFVTFEYQIGGKWLGLLRDTAPRTNRVAVLFDLENPSQPAYLEGIEAAAPTFGMEVMRARVRRAAEIEQTIHAFAQQRNGGVLVVPSALAIRHYDVIIGVAAQSRLPAVYPYRKFAESGGLISYGADLHDAYRKAASYIDRILRGAKTGDLPVQLANKFELVVNLKTAKALGLTIPEPFLQQADEVIE